MEGGGREGGRELSRRAAVDEACAYDILLAANCSAARSSAAARRRLPLNVFFFYCQCCSHAVRPRPTS